MLPSCLFDQDCCSGDGGREGVVDWWCSCMNSQKSKIRGLGCCKGIIYVPLWRKNCQKNQNGGGGEREESVSLAILHLWWPKTVQLPFPCLLKPAQKFYLHMPIFSWRGKKKVCVRTGEGEFWSGTKWRRRKRRFHLFSNRGSLGTNVGFTPVKIPHFQNQKNAYKV